jgi:LCP family protein required for cell wall assembly
MNILCLGLDSADPNTPYRRSDTVIVISVDLAGKSAGMLSIPRDLYVPITGLNPPQRNRINTAYVWGEYYRYPGGGPALAMRTVRETLGIPIDHYAAIDFRGFVKAIDALGGVDITLDKALSDPHLTKWAFPAGRQHMDGETALRFARVRYMDSDFQRERRQQKLLLALRDQALRPDTLPRLPALLTSLWGAVKTDLSPAQVLSLVRLGSEIDASRIHNHIVDETMVTSYRTPAGAAVLLPNEAAIRKLAQEVLSAPSAKAATPIPIPSPSRSPTTRPVSPTATASPTARPTPPVTDKARLLQEAARVELLNGAGVRNLAASTRTILQGEGFQVARIGDADRFTYPETLLIVYVDKPFTRELLSRRLGIKPQNVQVTPNLKMGADLRVILGRDRAP